MRVASVREHGGVRCRRRARWCPSCPERRSMLLCGADYPARVAAHRVRAASVALAALKSRATLHRDIVRASGAKKRQHEIWLIVTK